MKMLRCLFGYVFLGGQWLAVTVELQPPCGDFGGQMGDQGLAVMGSVEFWQKRRLDDAEALRLVERRGEGHEASRQLPPREIICRDMRRPGCCDRDRRVEHIDMAAHHHPHQQRRQSLAMLGIVAAEA